MRRCQDQVCCTVSFSWSSLQVIRGQLAPPRGVVVPLVCVCVFYLSSASLPTKPWPRVSCVCEGDNTYTQSSAQVLGLSERKKRRLALDWMGSQRSISTCRGHDRSPCARPFCCSLLCLCLCLSSTHPTMFLCLCPWSTPTPPTNLYEK